MLMNFRKKVTVTLFLSCMKAKKKYISIYVCMGRITNQRKVTKWLPFKSYKSESLNI